MGASIENVLYEQYYIIIYKYILAILHYSQFRDITFLFYFCIDYIDLLLVLG